MARQSRGPCSVNSRKRATALVCSLAVFATAFVAADAPPAKPAVANVEQQLDAHLQAGEFGLAVKLTDSVKDPAAKSKLLEKIADAALEAGESSAARSASGRMSDSAGRSRVQKQAARNQLSANGGGAQFGPLIQLIQDNTGGEPDGPWQDVDGEGGTIGSYQLGVRVDPQGLLDRITRADDEGRLSGLGVKARAASLNSDMAKASNLRMVSLTRLEKAVAERVRAGEPVLETMRQLAGLSQIHYVFVYPEEHEVIVAGPAEGWRYNAQGLPVGVTSGRPTLHLDDLVVLMRTFTTNGGNIFGCSINPRPDNLKAVKQFVEASQAQGPLGPGKLPSWMKGIHERMGLQDIEIFGVPANTRVGRTLVEADYRMKLIGIGKVDGGSGIPSIFELLPVSAQKDPPPLNALRWWMTMKYDAILHSPNRDVFEVQGSSVLVQSEDQIVTNTGDRIQTGNATGVNQTFAKNFTANYAELAKRDLVFADLQNIFDLGLVAALCYREHLPQRAGWDMGMFAPTGDYRVAVVEAPKVVNSVINHRVYRGKDIVVQVAGGVRADMLGLVKDKELTRENPALSQVPQKAKPVQLPEGRWWWDAAE
ncbi:MAG TPA: DUF1598 domain-containing protein [Planctomycetaceae bacterium]|nr:DUF1598 domain-containing protein [Planctomycetaceae bacterium]